jgi:hypothetical protein
VKVFVAVLEPFKGAGQVSAVGSLVPGNPGALKLTYVDGSTGCLLLERATGRLSFVLWDKKGICRQVRLAEGKELPAAGTVGPAELNAPISSLVRTTEEASVAMDYSQNAFRAYISAPKECEAVFASDSVDRLSVDGVDAKADWANGQLKVRLSRGVHILSAKTLGEGPRIEQAGSVRLWKGLPFKSCLE